MLVGMVLAISLGATSLTERGQCISTGDISHSDHFTVLNKFSSNCYKILSKDKVGYDFCVSPTSKTNWHDGTYIEFADYELRNGYADFTVPGGKFKKWDSEEAYVSRR